MILSILFIVVNALCFYAGIRNRWPMWVIVLNFVAVLFNASILIGHLVS